MNLLREQLVDFPNNSKGIRHVKHIGLAPGPAAVGVEIDRAALGDESPTDRVRFLTMTAGGQPLGMPRRRAGLPNLVQMSEEREHRLAFPAEIDE